MTACWPCAITVLAGSGINGKGVALSTGPATAAEPAMASHIDAAIAVAKQRALRPGNRLSRMFLGCLRAMDRDRPVL